MEWQQRDNESDKAYAAFVTYRDMSPNERSLAKVGKKLGKSTTLMDRWSSAYEWQARVNAWDTHQLRKREQDDEQARLDERRQRRQYLGAWKSLIAKAMAGVNGDAPDVSDVERITRIMDKYLTQSRAEFNDMPTQRQEHTGKDGGPIEMTDNLSDDERAARIAALLERARARRDGRASSD